MENFAKEQAETTVLKSSVMGSPLQCLPERTQSGCEHPHVSDWGNLVLLTWLTSGPLYLPTHQTR